MGWWGRLGNSLWLRNANRDRIAEEMEFHIEQRTRDNLARGMAPAEARTDARRRFGNPTLLRETTMDVDRLAWVDSVVRDIRLALRSLSRRPALALTAIGSLALGIGANSAIFSIVDAVLLEALPLPHPDRLVVIEESKNGETSGSNPARMADWGSQVRDLEAVTGFYSEGLVYTGGGNPERLKAIRTLGRPLAVLGVRPLLGRGFTPAEEASLGDRVAMMGERFWRRRFGADPHLLGRSLSLSGEPFVVIGILPDRLGYPEKFDLFAPAPLDVQRASRQAGFLRVVARLKPEAALKGIQAQLSTVAARLAQQYPKSDAGRSARAVLLQEDLVGEARLPLLLLLGTVGLVLLITCVNIASLLLARAAERRREAAIRVSLGAGRGGLMQLYLVESLVLAFAGGSLGLGLAAVSLASLKSLLPGDIPHLADAHLDLRVVAFSFLLSAICGLAFGLAPAWHAARVSPGGGMREGGRAGRSIGGLRTRRFLVIAEVMLSVVLLVGVGLLGKSLLLLRRAPLGFQAGSVLTVKIDFPWNTPDTKLDGFTARALEGFAAIPGVSASGVVDRLPLEGESQSGAVALNGGELPPELVEKPVSHRAASPGYFTALGVPLKAGRLLRERANREGPREAVVNETLARLYFPEGRALGRQITFDTKPENGKTPIWLEIVGIVGDVRMTPSQSAQMPEVFVLPRDTYWPMSSFVLRTQGNPQALIPAVRAAVRRIDPEQVIDGISTLDEGIQVSTSEPRIRVWLVGAFACIAVWLAALGLYGVLASDVAQRTHEIGVRLALGASRDRVSGMIFLKGTAMVLAGLLLGLAGATALARWIGSLLFGVHPIDASVLASVSVVMALLGAAASYFPAVRAAEVDPGVALRHE